MAAAQLQNWSASPPTATPLSLPFSQSPHRLSAGFDRNLSKNGSETGLQSGRRSALSSKRNVALRPCLWALSHNLWVSVSRRHSKTPRFPDNLTEAVRSFPVSKRRQQRRGTRTLCLSTGSSSLLSFFRGETDISTVESTVSNDCESREGTHEFCGGGFWKGSTRTTE